jgi:hypothetical protein
VLSDSLHAVALSRSGRELSYREVAAGCAIGEIAAVDGFRIQAGRAAVGRAAAPARAHTAQAPAAAPGPAVSHARLCTLFWPDAETDDARNCLNDTMHRQRRDRRIAGHEPMKTTV